MAYPLDGWTGTSYFGGVGRSWSTATARRYGEAVAARLHGFRNVIWAVGGDYSDETAVNARFNAVLAGLRSGGMDRATTIQRIADTTSLDSSYWDEKVDFSFVYSYALSYAMVQKGYRQVNPARRHVPAILGEAHYEAYPNVTNLYLRSMAAWALTSGSPGEFYGSENVWASAPTTAALKTTAVNQLSAMRRVFGRLAGWQRLVPDFSSTFITAGRGAKGNATDDYFPGDQGGTYVTGARTSGRAAGGDLPARRQPADHHRPVEDGAGLHRPVGQSDQREQRRGDRAGDVLAERAARGRRQRLAAGPAVRPGRAEPAPADQPAGSG